MYTIETENFKLFGERMFNQLPNWARMLEWKVGKPEFDSAGHVKYPCLVLSPGAGGQVMLTVVGEENLMGGICNCCTNGFEWSDPQMQVFAHATLPWQNLQTQTP